MSSYERQPPSGRDFEVFEAVILGGKSTRQAAEQFHLSQTRICQIVERVKQWQAEAAPQNSDVSSERLLQLAKAVAAGRLDHLYGEMMQAWRRSQGEVKKVRSSRFGDDVTTTTVSPGDPKYPLAAMRLAKAQAELGVFGGLICPPEEDAEDEDRKGRPEARPTAAPPARDCSDSREPAPAAASSRAPEPLATTSAQTASAELSPRQLSARERFFQGVQPPLPAGKSAAATTQIQITPAQPGLSVKEILNREGRRSRRAG
jgi:hypothetical protein